MAGTFGYGAILVLGGTTISELTSISAPGYSADSIDTTTHSSADGYREFIQGLRDGGEISISGNYTTAAASAISTQFNTTSIVTATVTMPTTPSASRFTASVFVTGFTVEDPHDDKITYSATLKVTGKPTLGLI